MLAKTGLPKPLERESPAATGPRGLRSRRVKGHGEAILGHRGPRLGNPGAVPRPFLGSRAASMRPRWATSGSQFAHVVREFLFHKNSVSPRRERYFGSLPGQDEAKMEVCWDPVGLCWAWFGPMLPYVGPDWTQGGSCWPSLRPC